MSGLIVSTILVTCWLIGTVPKGRMNTFVPVMPSSTPSTVLRFFPGGSPSWLEIKIYN